MDPWRAVAACAFLLCGAASAADPEAAARQVVELTNAFRAAEGREKQSMNQTLAETARDFAAYMAKTRKYGHTADGRTPAQRASAHGYDYCLILENIALQYDSRGFETQGLAKSFVEGWKHSPEHRHNMLDAAATETGVGLAQGEKGRWYGVQLFGRPKSAAIRFSVVNRSGLRVEYHAAGRPFSLAPRVTRTHTVCRATDLAVELPSGERFKTRVQPGMRYAVERARVIEQAGGKPPR